MIIQFRTLVDQIKAMQEEINNIKNGQQICCQSIPLPPQNNSIQDFQTPPFHQISQQNFCQEIPIPQAESNLINMFGMVGMGINGIVGLLPARRNLIKYGNYFPFPQNHSELENYSGQAGIMSSYENIQSSGINNGLNVESSVPNYALPNTFNSTINNNNFESLAGRVNNLTQNIYIHNNECENNCEVNQRTLPPPHTLLLKSRQAAINFLQNGNISSM